MKYQSYSEWTTANKALKLPKWDELPKFELYMDQLLEYVNEVLAPLEIGPVTATMINNYVKKKVIFPPLKKKYGNTQIADIILLTMLKSVFALDQIRQGMDQITISMYPKRAYDYYVEQVMLRFQNSNQTQIKTLNENPQLALIDTTIEAMISKLNAEKILLYSQAQKVPQKVESK